MEKQVTGTIKKIDDSKTFGANGFRKRELVVSTDEQYPQLLLIEFIQDRCELLDDYEVGQGVKISINFKGREWINPEGEAKYFNTIQGWAIAKTDEKIVEKDDFDKLEYTISENEPDDLPF